jgi:hypothetical protein
MAVSGLRDFDAVVIQFVSVSFALARHVHGSGMPMNQHRRNALRRT